LYRLQSRLLAPFTKQFITLTQRRARDSSAGNTNVQYQMVPVVDD